MDLSVVIPVFNEKPNLVSLLDELEEVLEASERSYEVIIVDDGSRDGSQELLRELCSERPRVRAVLLRRNFGQSAAFDCGFSLAEGRYVVSMDGDMQNDPRDIPALLAKLEEGYDFVSGRRAQRKDGLVLRKIPSRIANALIRWVTRVPVRDLGCSLKAYRSDIVAELRLYGEMHRFIAVLVDGMGARIAELDVNHRARRAGRSKYGLGRAGKVLLDLTTVWFMRSFQTKPIYVFGGGGLLMMLAGAAISLYVLWEKLALDIWVHRNPLFIIAVMLFLVGVQSVGVGLVAEIIIRTYFEARGRPSYLVRERLGFEADAAQGEAVAGPAAAAVPAAPR